MKTFRELVMEKGYIIVKFVSGSDKLLSEITMSGNQNLHNTRQQIFDAGWVDCDDTLYLLPSGYIYRCKNGNFALDNPEFEAEIPEFYLT
jgi:hypothetical protein